VDPREGIAGVPTKTVVADESRVRQARTHHNRRLLLQFSPCASPRKGRPRGRTRLKGDWA